MQSDLPKVVFPVGGRAMVCAVVDACLAAGCGRVIVVVGHKQELVRDALWSYVQQGQVEFAVQEPQLGTGHAVACASPLIGAETGHNVFVLCGDGPLIRARTLLAVLERHRTTGAQATLATAELDDPSGYGRILRDQNGRFGGIVEEKNATPEQLRIREVNPSYYCFDAGALLAALPRVKHNAASGEYYLTDVPELLAKDGCTVEVVEAVSPEDVLSINTPADLARVDAMYRARQATAPGKVG